jgi:putative phosphoesterase
LTFLADPSTTAWRFGNTGNREAAMRIGVISDTHAHVQNTQRAVRMLESLEVEEVLHCGDICSTSIPPLLAAWPAHFVFGNCDHESDELREAIAAAGLTCHGLFGDFELGGRRIALIHSHDARLFRRVTTSGEYDLVCYGHSHIAEQHRQGKTLILNPGALYRADPHTIAVVELDSLEATIVPL